jgi:hypothetical protein
VSVVKARGHPWPPGATGLFPSFFLGGFECSSHRRSDRHRLDLIAGTRHDAFAEQDYAALAAHGLRAARDGVRWHLVERVPGIYDWSSVLPMMRAARQAGVRVAWDICHYGYPDHIHPLSEEFVVSLARFAAAFAKLAAEEEGEPPIICPVNEISFWAWGGGQVGYFNPGVRGRGWELKQRLVAAALAAGRAAREAVPGTRVLAVDPLIHVVARRPEDERGAAGHRHGQFEAWDALLGRCWPELGGGPDGFDVQGVNYYWNNQWEHRGRTIRMGRPRHRPFRELLAENYARYGRPLFISETSIEGTPRPAWLRYVGEEVRAAIRAGIPVEAICLYPVVSHLGWVNDRYCPNGLFEMHPVNGRRPVVAPLAAELARQQAMFEAMARGEPVPEDTGAAAAFVRAFNIARRTPDPDRVKEASASSA